MTLECITHKELLSFLSSERYTNSEILPLSKQRGVSHHHNPKALPHDVVLINIYEEEKLVAYLGLLPDDIHSNGDIFHIGWLSCMWVAPNSRGKGYAKKLLKTAWEKWKESIAVTEFTIAAGTLYNKTGYFKPVTSRDGRKLYYKLNLSTFLPKKNPNWKSIRFPLKMLDIIANSVLTFKNLILKPKENAAFYIQQIPNVDNEVLAFIKHFQQEEFTTKDTDYFEWLTTYPWLSNNDIAEKDQKKYFFSVYAKKTKLVHLKFYQENKLVAFVTLTLKNDAVKVPFVYFDKESSILAEQIMIQILKFMNTERASTIHLSHDILTKHFLDKKHLFFFIRRIKKEYIISKSIFPHLENSSFNFQDGDGDAAFT